MNQKHAKHSRPIDAMVSKSYSFLGKNVVMIGRKKVSTPFAFIVILIIAIVAAALIISRASHGVS